MKELIERLENVADTMKQLGDLPKAKACSDAAEALKDFTLPDEFDIALAENMFSKHELARLYVKKLEELERLKASRPKDCPWCKQPMR